MICLMKYLRMPEWIALILGGLTYFSFAPYRYFWLMPLLFAGLIYLMIRHEHKAVRLAYCWGFSAYLIHNYWVYISLHDVGGLPAVVAMPMTALFPLYLALYPALSAWITRRMHTFSTSVRYGLIFPLAWTFSEYLRHWALTGFGWGALGYSQMVSSPLSGLTPVGGIFLVTLATAFCGAWLAMLLLPQTWKIRPTWALGILLLCVLSGSLKNISWTKDDGSLTRVALVQGNVAQTLKFDPDYIQQNIQSYYDEIRQIHDADIVILPESAIPVLRESLPVEILHNFAEVAKKNQFSLAVGMIQLTPERNGYQNVVFHMTEEAFRQPENHYYAKNHLVPFGEFRPLPAITAWIYQLMNMPLSDFSSGGKGQMPLYLGNQKVAFNICYEDSFGDELIASAKQSTMMANVSNMGWFGRSNAMNLQLQHAQARALENGRYLVRATNNGMTAVVNPQGKITALIPRDTKQILKAPIKGFQGETPYMKMGGSLPLILGIGCLLVVLGFWNFKRKTTHKRG